MNPTPTFLTAALLALASSLPAQTPTNRSFAGDGNRATPNDPLTTPEFWTPAGLPGLTDSIGIETSAELPPDAVLRVRKLDVFQSGGLTLGRRSRLTVDGELYATYLEPLHGSTLVWNGPGTIDGTPARRGRFILWHTANPSTGGSLQVTSNGTLIFAWPSTRHAIETMNRPFLNLSGELTWSQGSRLVIALRVEATGTRLPTGAYALVRARAVNGPEPTLELEGFSADAPRPSLRIRDGLLTLVVP
jgi:hypothetical protein